MFPYIFSLLIGYLIGSIPTAYLLVHWKRRVDIRTSGSGNVGSLNAYEVTGSKTVGVFVMLIDALKGASAVFIVSFFAGHDFWILGLAGIGSVLGHNYSPWIRFKGGRGLATGAGVMIVISWYVLVLWLTVWIIAKIVLHNVHVANIVASIISPIVVLIRPNFFFTPIIMIDRGTSHLLLWCIVIFLLILIRHVKPALALWQSSHSSFFKKS